MSQLQNFPRIFQVLEDGCTKQLHTGVQIHVSVRGTTVLSTSIGERRPGEPMTNDTLLLWLSAGKPLTALAVAQQRERGTLSLDDLVVRHIPEFGMGGKECITIRHLLTHTAGFRGADSLPVTYEWAEAIQRICRVPLEQGWIPGTTAGYQTHSSWYILGEIVRRLDGRAFPHYLREEILLPLGMPDTWVGMPRSEFDNYGSRIGTTYETLSGSPVPHATWDSPEACGHSRPGGSARGPASQLGRFYEALLDGGRGVVREDTLREFTKRQRAGVFDQTFRHEVDMGLGFILNSILPGRPIPPYNYGPHASRDTFGHSGSQSSCGFADPAHGLAVAWICNGLPGEPRHQRRQNALNTAIYEDLGLVEAK